MKRLLPAMVERQESDSKRKMILTKDLRKCDSNGSEEMQTTLRNQL